MVSARWIVLLSGLYRQCLGQTQSKRRAKIVMTSAEDVGAAHYTIIESLKSTLEQKIPLNSHEFMHILATELRESLCDEDDYECEAMTYRHVLSGKSRERRINESPSNSMDHFRSELPDDFDYEVELAMENTFEIVGEISNIGIEQAVYLMNEELQKLKQSDTIIDEDHRTVGVAAISVGIESIKQWTEVLSDPNHIFLKVPFVEYNAQVFHDKSEMNRQRELQLDNITDTISSSIDTVTDFINNTLGNVVDVNVDTIPLIGPIVDGLLGGEGLNVSSITSVILDAAAASGLNLVPIVSKDILGGSFGALVSYGRKKKKDGILKRGIRFFCTATSGAVAGSVIGFFESLADLLDPNSEC